MSDRDQQPGLGNGEDADSFRHIEVDDPGQGDKQCDNSENQKVLIKSSQYGTLSSRKVLRQEFEINQNFLKLAKRAEKAL